MTDDSSGSIKAPGEDVQSVSSVPRADVAHLATMLTPYRNISATLQVRRLPLVSVAAANRSHEYQSLNTNSTEGAISKSATQG